MHPFTLDDLAREDIERVGQIDDPIQSDVPFEPNVGPDSGHEFDGLRTLSGLLDLMHDVVEEFDEWVERETPHGPGHKRMPPRSKPVVIPVRTLAAAHYRVVTFVLQAPETLVATAREDRTRLVITNYGPGTVFYSDTTASNAAGPQMGQGQIPVGSSREMFHQDRVYVFPTAANVPTIDVHEEYGLK